MRSSGSMNSIMRSGEPERHASMYFSCRATMWSWSECLVAEGIVRKEDSSALLMEEGERMGN